MLQGIHQHQVVQSPARLGLPNPNSPSLQNSNPSKFSSQTQQNNLQTPSNQLPTPTVSPTLLPLLPPLPRAQALLLQMASLSSNLFNVSPNRSQWLSSFRGTLPSFLSPQAQTQTQFTTVKEILSQFTTLQTQLFEAVAELQEILDLQDAKQKLTRDIKSKDTALLSFANKLKQTERVLDILVDDYSNYRQNKRIKSENSSSLTTTVSHRLKLSDILSYAHKISYTTFAPPEFGAGQGPLKGALPPAPQEEQMRASLLYSFKDLDVGLPQNEEMEEKLVVEPFVEVSPVPGLLIPSNIVIPSGWKPGMPVELPSDLPILPPAGWKPGDPISLPPLDSIPRPEEQVRPAGLGRGPEPIQVRHVQLDIEDDSSDYSSDGGSSESED